ncbi:hypothetical protein CEQ21_24785 [Niallia circulans]|uniref:Tetratrico peptide repeat group 5 domain-containing protein n=1 Tax=Niallia circulans TaxID=1397 RepID=A0A553SNN2_NIACI|nr:tetratricopeptide repeat protein [Niallia circulans]TRZ38600.1 hypothetical protein CEQ21_24785 [Niallia circulans]
MDKELSAALHARACGDHANSNRLLLDLAQQFPNDASILYQCAWSFDLLGEERKAVFYYEKAIELKLPLNELEGALLGLGSTYRTLGEYEKSRNTFIQGIEKFPQNKAFQAFYAMTLYNLKEHDQAMKLLLTCLVDTTADEQLLNYQKAIRFYADKLDEKWESSS